MENAVEPKLATMPRDFKEHFNVSHTIVLHELKMIGQVSVVGKKGPAQLVSSELQTACQLFT